MSSYDFDLFTIGAGSGGVRASRMAARAGARVAVAEERHLGGTCVNIGCVPKKLMVYAAHYGEEFEDAAGFGWTVGPRQFSWSTLIGNKNAEIKRLNSIYEHLLTSNGVQIIEGRARLVEPHVVEVAGKRYSAEHILIATGGRPFKPEGQPGAEEFGLVSDDVFFLKEQPRRLLVVGGGYIAVEFAGVFQGLGSEVTQIYRGPHFLRGFDDDIRVFLADEMRKKGIDLCFNTNVLGIEKTESGLMVTLTDDRCLEVDAVLYATGRRPNVADLGLEEIGVACKPSGAIVVDPHYRTSVPGIHAIGDVTDRINLTPVAIAEAMALVKTLFHGQPSTLDYDNIPTAVFSQPPIGTVGLTEAEARSRYGAIDVYTSEFRPMKHTLSGRSERTLMKLIVERATDKVVGVHMVGPDAGEILQGIAIALKAGATKAQFDSTIGIHPTAAEEFVTMREKVPEQTSSDAPGHGGG